MLKIFRQKNVTKLILWGLLILILPAFVLWGTGAGGGRSKDGAPTFVGLIDDNKVTFSEFAESLTSIKCQIILNYFNQPKVLTTFLNSKAFLGKLAWDRLLMIKEARKTDIRISNDEVIKFVRSHPIFLRNDAFDDKMYAYVLRNNIGLEPRAFEEMIRDNLGIQRLNDRLARDIKVSDEEIAEAYRADNEKLKISYVLFAADSFLDKAKVEDSQIQDYYEEHKSEFILPAKEGDKDKTAGNIAELDDVRADIKAFLAEKQAREIAVKYAGEQHGKLKDLMAKENLEFEASAASLGLKAQESAFFSRPEYIEGVGEANQVAEEAVKLKPDEVSGPIETRKGVIIFRVTDSQKIDEEKFKKEKDDYSKRVLEMKKMLYLENWLKGLEEANKVNIDFKDYEKYYR